MSPAARRQGVSGPRDLAKRRRRDLGGQDLESCDVFHLDPAKVAALRTTLLGEGSVTALAETFKMLGDGTRVRLLDALSRSELCVCDLARLLSLTQSAVSHQLRLLRGMRLVRPRRAGRMVFYTLDDQHIVGLFEQGLEHVQESARGHANRPRVVGADPRVRQTSAYGPAPAISRGSTRQDSARGHASGRTREARSGREASASGGGAPREIRK